MGDFRLALGKGPRGYAGNWNLSATYVLAQDMVDSGLYEPEEKPTLVLVALKHIKRLTAVYQQQSGHDMGSPTRESDEDTHVADAASTRTQSEDDHEGVQPARRFPSQLPRHVLSRRNQRRRRVSHRTV